MRQIAANTCWTNGITYIRPTNQATSQRSALGPSKRARTELRRPLHPVSPLSLCTNALYTYYICIFMCVCVCVCTYMRININILYTRICIYVHIYTHTHTGTGSPRGCATGGDPRERGRDLPWANIPGRTFSKVSALVYFLYKATVERALLRISSLDASIKLLFTFPVQTVRLVYLSAERYKFPKVRMAIRALGTH